MAGKDLWPKVFGEGQKRLAKAKAFGEGQKEISDENLILKEMI